MDNPIPQTGQQKDSTAEFNLHVFYAHNAFSPTNKGFPFLIGKMLLNFSRIVVFAVVMMSPFSLNKGYIEDGGERKKYISLHLKILKM